MCIRDRLGWFPVISDGVGAKSVALPALTLAIAMSAKYLRQVRATVLDELGKSYVTGARARGVRFSVTLVRSVLKASLVTIITLLTLSIGSLLGGTAIVESIFLWDGVGKLAEMCIRDRACLVHRKPSESNRRNYFLIHFSILGIAYLHFYRI